MMNNNRRLTYDNCDRINQKMSRFNQLLSRISINDSNDNNKWMKNRGIKDEVNNNNSNERQQ